MKKNSLLLTLLLIFALFLAACGGEEEAPATATTPAIAEETAEEVAPEEASNEETDTAVDIEGCNVDLTGETITVHQQAGREGPLAAIMGQAFAFATDDAVAIINEEGGICGANLVVEFNETSYDTEQEIAVYEQTRDEAIVILTYGSGATVALASRLNEDKIVSFVAGVHGPSIYAPRDGYTFGMVPIYSDQFAGFLQWLNDNWADVKPETAADEIVVGVVGWANVFGAGATTDEALAYADSLGITVLPLEEVTVTPDADVSGSVQNLVANGANVIYNQSLSFTPAQVIGAVRALGVWDSVVVAGTNWAFNNDVLGFLGNNAALAEGYYGVVPHATWADTDNPGIQIASQAFEAGGYPENERTNTYLLAFSSLFAVRDVLIHAINEYGYENLSGETVLQAISDIGVIGGLDVLRIDGSGQNRAPNQAQIRQWQLQADGSILDVPVSDVFELPDTRPSP